MSLDVALLEILACPNCKGNLEYQVAKSCLECKECRLRFRIEDDIPIMLMEDAERI